MSNNSPNSSTPTQTPQQNPPPNSPRDWLAVLMVGSVAIAFLISAVVPEHSNFAELWPVVQPVFWLIIGYYFGARLG